MIKRTFLDKTNTIRRSSYENYGLHPVCMLNYGGEMTRVLLHFNIDGIKEWLKDKEKALECKHILRMTNYGSIDLKKFGLTIPSYDIRGEKDRAVSFTLYAFPIEEEWDEGVGFDSIYDFWLSGKSIVSNEGSNWFNRKSGYKWLKTGCIGIYPDIDNAIASQHFEHGNENLELDITDYVNGIIFSGNPNYGLCLIFDPELERGTDYRTCKVFDTIDATVSGETYIIPVNKVKEVHEGKKEDKPKLTQYVGFFGNKTNTFYEPVVESRIDDYIKDDRYNFILGKNNRLYFYCSEDSKFLNLDVLPICTIDGDEYPVTQQDTGIYYATVNLSGAPDMIHYDEWSNLSLSGDIGDLEFEFVTHPSLSRFNIGPEISQETILEPSLSGVNDDEVLNKGDIRKVNIKLRVPYTTKYFTKNGVEYRIYSKDGNREVTVIDWDGVNNAGSINYFLIKADELVPGDYYVDIRVTTKSQVKTFKEKLKFKKASDIAFATR